MAPWRSTQLGSLSKLVYAEVYAGPPRNEQVIMPDEYRDQPGRVTMNWRFRGQPAREGIWLVCAYQNTQVRLELRLPESVTECSQINSTDERRPIKLMGQSCR